jgi:small subunit ribosomal protein S5
MAHNKDDEKSGGESSYVERTVKISRVAKVVKGGRRFSFSAIVVAGDGGGAVGIGLGKASEVPDAVRKATEQARKEMRKYPIYEGTIPHEVQGKFGPTTVILKPAAPGTGVIAGAAARSIAEALGIRDIRTKCIGSNNAHNVLHATLDGLSQLFDPKEVSKAREISLDELEYQPY